MPIQTDLNISPYFDDYNEDSGYYKVLFRPGVSVQVRELNQLQSILQKQIENFGNSIYVKGSIIDGCNFIFHNPLPYVKINDQEIDGTPVKVSTFKGFFVKNSAGLNARIVETSEGFESTAPDLNTLHINYTNHGTSGVETSFMPQDILTIYSPEYGIVDVDVMVKSAGFSNNDIPVFLSAVTVEDPNGGQSYTNTSGQACTFVAGDVITQEFTNAQAEITEVNTTANNTHLVLKIRPLASQLKIGNTQSWSFIEDYPFTSNVSYVSGKLKNVIGSGASGTIVTDLTGGIIFCSITTRGSGYYVEPYISAYYKTPNTQTSSETLINSLNLVAKTYRAKVTVGTDTASVGNGYGISVTSGVIYQKGYFSKVKDQFIVVDKYNALTNNVVGFDTSEEIATARTDDTLYDNATGTPNYNAPGANRLKLTPKLVSMSKSLAAANTDFLNIIEFSEGRPYKQNPTTKFNSITKELARRTFEESGNYVLDPFLVNTQSTNVFADEATSFELYVDPGLAYIDGYRVERLDGYSENIKKGIDTVIATTDVSLNYGNYIKVNELGGVFDFSVGGTISLRDTAKLFVSSGTIGAITAAGTEIGTARVRSLTLISGTAGLPTAEYWMYIFDIRMINGKNFDDVRSVYYNGLGTADLILVDNKAKVFDPQNSTMLFPLNTPALKNANNLSYTYRTINRTLTCNTQGKIAVSVAQNLGEYFPYVGGLSEIEKSTVIVIPLANAVVTTNSTGQVSTSTSSVTVTGTSTAFLSDYQPGDYIRIANSSSFEYKQILSISSDTSLKLTTNSSHTYTSANTTLAFPANIPVPLYGRTNRSVAVVGNTTLNISLGNSISGSISAAVAYDVQRKSDPVSKSVTRHAYVKIRTADNSGGKIGPWCLGLPDIIRLENVYLGNSTAVTTSDSVVTENFWIDHNQRKDYYDVGFLYKKPGYSIIDDTYLLIEFDVFTSSAPGLKAISSYPINDTLSYSNSTSTINTLEIPEMYHDNDTYYDLRDCIDFRPYSSNSAILTTSASEATINPEEPTQLERFDITTDKKFPAPQSDCSLTYEQYLGRIDSVIMTSNNDIRVIKGIPSINPVAPTIPNQGLFIENLIIPPYPSLPKVKGSDLLKFLERRIASIKYTTRRQNYYIIKQPINPDGTKRTQQTRYTMADIGKLEQRIKDLEYYTALSFSENRINNLELTSSINPATNRFKFGFFVDNFTTTSFSDTDDPHYNAQIFNFQLTAKKDFFNCLFIFNEKDPDTIDNVGGVVADNGGEHSMRDTNIRTKQRTTARVKVDNPKRSSVKNEFKERHKNKNI